MRPNISTDGIEPSHAIPNRTKLRIARDRFIRSWNLVELTGIEPVASWLQTRRSPS
jgi:hypothetical protein